MKFSFKAEVNGQWLTLDAERIYRSQQSERFKLSITGTGYVVMVQTNRPAASAKNKGKTAQWHMVEGKTEDKTMLDQVYAHLERALQNQEPVFQGTLNFIDHF